MKEGWERKKLNEVCDLLADGDWIESKDQSDSGFRLIQTGNVGIGEFKQKSGKERFVSASTFKNLRCTEIFTGDILVSRLPDPVGRACVVPSSSDRMITAVDCSIIRLNNAQVLTNYFKYYSQSQQYFTDVSRKITGTTRDRISRSNLSSIEIDFPKHIKEQQRIVSILDEAFAAIDKAKANVQKNLANAKELFQSELNAIFSQKGEGWVEKGLGEVIDFLNGYAFKSGDAISKSNTQLVRMGNLYQNRLDLDRSPVFYPDSFAKDYKKFTIKEGDLVISLTGTAGKEDFGFALRIPSTNHALLLNQRISKISIKDETILSKQFVHQFFTSRVFLDVLFSIANGTRQANLSTETMKKMTIAFPNIKHQQIIVDQLRTLFSKTERLQEIYFQKLTELESLKKSILQKAFTGELVTEKEIVEKN